MGVAGVVAGRGGRLSAAGAAVAGGRLGKTTAGKGLVEWRRRLPLRTSAFLSRGVGRKRQSCLRVSNRRLFLPAGTKRRQLGSLRADLGAGSGLLRDFVTGACRDRLSRWWIARHRRRQIRAAAHHPHSSCTARHASPSGPRSARCASSKRAAIAPAPATFPSAVHRATRQSRVPRVDSDRASPGLDM
jgi:hypothetical protein